MNPSRPPAPRRPVAPRAPAPRAGGSRADRTGTAAPAPTAVPPAPVAVPAPAAAAPVVAAGAALRGDPGRPGGRAVVSTPRRPASGATVVTQAAERFAERGRTRRRIAWRQVTVALGVLLVVAGLGWAALFSPLLALHADRVSVVGASEVVGGARPVDPSLITAKVAGAVGVPLTRLDTVALRERLLTVPGVKAIRVMRDWPHGLTVTVTPRRPVAAVPETDSGYLLLDEEGVQVGRSAGAPEGLPVVSVPTDDARALTAVLTVLHALPTSLATQVSAVGASTQDAVRLTLSDGVVVVWGSAQDDALKARVVATLRASKAVAGVHEIDVSAPLAPVVS